jgi:L-lysine epsilon oxidase C-terminal domain
VNSWPRVSTSDRWADATQRHTSFPWSSWHINSLLRFSGLLHKGVDPSKINVIRIYPPIESAIRRMVGISAQKYLGDMTNPSADSRMPKGQCNDRLVYSNIRYFTSLTQSCHAPRRSRTLPPLDYTMDYDACDALLHHVSNRSVHHSYLLIHHPHLHLFSHLQTQGDAWSRPTEENVSARVCLRVHPSQFRVLPCGNESLAAALTKAALEPTIGIPLYPGIEMSWNAELPETYQLDVPFTSRDDALPGDLTKYLSLPRQSDFYECRSYW